MKLVSDGKAVGCLVATEVHRALRDAASASGLSVAQMTEVLIRRGLDLGGAADAPDQTEAHYATLRQMQAERDAARLDITGLKIAVTRAETDAAHWRETAERENDALTSAMADAAQQADERAALEDQLEQLRSRLIEMEVALAAPVKNSKNFKLTEMPDDAPAGPPLRSPLSDEEVRLVRAYRSAGWTASSICREMNISLFAVDAALGRK